MDILKIKDLSCKIDSKEILDNFNITVKSGEVHAIMGPNGTGKSTLSQVIMGNKKYEVTNGDILLNDESIKDLEVDQRARLGLFLAYQYPISVDGVTNSDFLRQAVKAVTNKEVSLFSFIKDYEKACKDLKMRSDLPHRYLNDGFSGGERKRNEVLQMKMLKPKFAILDEIDSGLDVDALKIVGTNVYNEVKERNLGLIVITHYERLLDYIKPDYVHIMLDGKIVLTGKDELIKRIDNEGYDWVRKELGLVSKVKEIKAGTVLGSCSIKDKHEKK